MNGTGSSCGDASRPEGAAALLERLAVAEAGIREDRHRQPAAVLEEIARLWTARATVPDVAARAGVSPHIVRDRLRRAEALDYVWREQHRHVREVLERRGATLIAAYKSGASITALAARAGLGQNTLRDYLEAEGVTIRNPRRRAREVLETRGAELAAAYAAGASLNALAAGAGIAPDTLRASLAAHGVATRDYRRRAREIFEARGAGLIAAYEAGASLGAVAAEAGVSELTLRRFLVARGVAIDDPRHRRMQGILEARGAGLIAAYEAGTPLAHLADDVGIAPRTLTRFMAAEGVRLRDDRGRSGVKR